MLRRLRARGLAPSPAGPISGLTTARAGATRPPTSSEVLLDRQARERHAAIVEATPFGALPPTPAGFGIDALDPAAEGFVTLREAARRMEKAEAEVVEMVSQGYLETRGRLVRPAIVKVMGATA